MATRRLNEDGVPIRIRTRPLNGYRLPHFDGEAELAVEAACFDRMELTREYLLSGVQWDYEGPRGLANEIGRECRSAVSHAPLDSRCRAFRVSDDGRDESVMKMRVGDTVEGARWLVDLVVEFRHAHSVRFDNVDLAIRPPVKLKVRLVINPTRLAAHARMRGVVPADADWHELLTSDDETYRAIADTSVSLTHDNLLPTRFLQPVSLGTVIGETVVFLRAVDALIEHIVGAPLRGTRPEDGAALFGVQPHWSIRQAETYWEFGHVHAIEFVRQLRPTLWTLGNDVGERVWRLEDNVETIAFTARLTDTVRLALYPKTVDRVRLEVRYSKRPPGTSSQNIADRLRTIAENAAQRANRARRAIVERLGDPRTGAVDGSLDALCDLVTLLQDCYQHQPDRAGDILRLLLSRGGIRCRADEFPVSRAEAQMLKDRGIVTTSPLARHSTTGDLMYSLSPQYQPLFQHFSGLGGVLSVDAFADS